MGIILDTNILVNHERGNLDLAEKIKGREQESFFISVISASELLHGVWRAQNGAIRAKRQAYVEKILSNFPILPIDLAVARVHSQIWSSLRERGQMIGIHDSWIAATGLAHGLAVVTANIQEFSRVEGLTTEVW
jgi:predicted nucleic acid-binding protein